MNDWIKWDGGECPVPKGTHVELRFRDNDQVDATTHEPEDYRWSNKGLLMDIVAYRVIDKHSHYFKDVSRLSTVDVYRVLSLFNVTDQALGHAIKKLLVAGGRGGGKDISRDIQEAIDTLVRWQEMRREDATCARTPSKLRRLNGK